MDERSHDVVVIGGGPAGISAALECVDVKLDAIVLERGSTVGGQLAEIPHSIRNVPTGPIENGPALQAALKRSSSLLGARVLINQEVGACDLADGWVEAGGSRFRGRALLIASGSDRQRLPAASEGAFGGDVTYQVESRPDRFAGRHVVVVGGGDSAALDALELAETAASVKLVHRSSALTARRDIVACVRDDRRIEDFAGWEVAALEGTDRLEAVVLAQPATGKRRQVVAGGLVVKISRDPCTAPFYGQVELDYRGAVVVDELLQTSRHGVFAAGDVVSGAYWRVATAFGQGVLAARSILRHIESTV